MHIENTEKLKLWLTSCLGRMCDAEPTALAKYVLALVKKQKSEQQLKEFCIDQLNIFLLKNTTNFVDMLFETLRTKSYLQSNTLKNTNSLLSENNQKMLREEMCHLSSRENIPSSQIKHDEYDQQKYRKDNLHVTHSSSLQTRLYSNERATENSNELNHCDTDLRLKDSTNLQMSNGSKNYDENDYCMEDASCPYDPAHIPYDPKAEVLCGAVLNFDAQSQSIYYDTIPEPYNPEDPFMSAEDRASVLLSSNTAYKSFPVSHSVPNIQSLSQNNISKNQPRHRELIVLNSTKFPKKNVTATGESECVNTPEISSGSAKHQKDLNWSKVGSRSKKMSYTLCKSKHIAKKLNAVASVNKYSLTSGAIPQAHINFKEKRLKIQLELHEKMQMVLQSQLEYQKFVLERLSQSKNKKEKAQLKQMLEDLAPKITALQADVRKSSEDLKNFIKMHGNDGSNPQKELVDAEMDLFNKQQHGNDHATLLSKVNKLKYKIKTFGTANSHNIGVRKGRQYPSNARFTKKGVRNSSTALKLDNRPKTIFVSEGFQDMEDLSKYFGKFVGNIEKIETYGTGYAVTFSTRKAAEMALLNGRKLGEESLKISWFQEQQSRLDTLSGSHAVTTQSDNIHFMHDDDDDEDEDDDEDRYQARSWRW